MAKLPDACTDVPVLSSGADRVLNVTVSGLDEVIKKVMQEARKDHSAAVRAV